MLVKNKNIHLSKNLVTGPPVITSEKALYSHLRLHIFIIRQLPELPWRKPSEVFCVAAKWEYLLQQIILHSCISTLQSTLAPPDYWAQRLNSRLLFSFWFFLSKIVNKVRDKTDNTEFLISIEWRKRRSDFICVDNLHESQLSTTCQNVVKDINPFVSYKLDIGIEQCIIMFRISSKRNH